MNVRKVYGLLLLSLLLFIPSIPAQDAAAAMPEDPQSSPASSPPSRSQPKHNSAAGLFLRDVLKDQQAIWTSPFRMNRRQFFTIALPLAGATAALIATDEKAGKWLPNTPDQVLWSNRVSKMGAFYALGGLVGGVMIAGKVRKEPEVFQMGRRAAEAYVNAVIVNYAIKGITRRERPDTNDGEGRFWKGGMSFPSGHAMNSWAVATAVARNPKCPRWLAISSYSVAAIVSFSRWGARKHFPSDILVGSVFGGLIGNYVATRPH